MGDDAMQELVCDEHASSCMTDICQRHQFADPHPRPYRLRTVGLEACAVLPSRTTALGPTSPALYPGLPYACTVATALGAHRHELQTARFCRCQRI